MALGCYVQLSRSTASPLEFAPGFHKEPAMLRTSSHDRAAEALLAGEFQRNTQLAERSKRPSCFELLSIAIHRESGTHVHEIAANVASQLCWHLCDHELVERVAQRLQVPVAVIEEHDERAAHWLEDSVAMMSSAPVVRESHYVRQLVEATLELASAAHCVFVGRGAAWILPPEGSLRVALIAPLEHRIHVVMREQGLNAHDAANMIQA